MTTITMYQVTDDYEPVGWPHDTLTEAVLEAAGEDGYGARFLRMDDDGNIAPENPMRLFSGRHHIGNNPYIPQPADAFAPESTLEDDFAAMAEVAQKVYAGGVLHSKYAPEIRELTYTDGVLTHVDGVTLEQMAEDLDTTVDDIRDYWDRK
ncbi:MAG: hypothetical protein LBR05_00995 [Azoarcus sp.]|nr:hypothetical protein [Azoarcus sp.]